MWLRRAFYRALWGAALVLPLWVFLGRVFFGAPLGYQFLAQIILVPILFVVQVVATLIVVLRGSVRRDKAVSWIDVGALALAWLGQLGIGFFLVDSASSVPAASAFTALVGDQRLSLSTALSGASIGLTIVGGTALLGLAIWQAFREARASLERAVSAAGATGQPEWAAAKPGWAADPEHTIRITPRA